MQENYSSSLDRKQKISLQEGQRLCFKKHPRFLFKKPFMGRFICLQTDQEESELDNMHPNSP